MATLTFTLRRLSTNAIGQTDIVSDTVSLPAMLRIFSACERMLTQIERDLTSHGDMHGEWRISDTGIGSFTLALEWSQLSVNGPSATQTATVLIDGINGLEQEQEIPSELKVAGLRQMQAVAGALKSRGVEHELLVSSGVTGGSGRILHLMARQINQLLIKERVSYGSIEGKVELISVHKGNRKFNVYHTVTGKAVECNLPSHLETEIIAALKRRVVISGAIHRNWNGDPHRVEVERLRVLRENDELPSLDELMGSLPNLTGDLSTEEFIRMIRDDHAAE